MKESRTEFTGEASAERPSASTIVWNWRDGRNHSAHTRHVYSRSQGAVHSFIGLVIAVILFVLGQRTLALIAGSLATLSFLLAMISPAGLYTRLRRGVAQLGVWIGIALSWILLVPLFYLFFLPFGLLLRRGARDSMERNLDSTGTSYWKKRKKANSNPETDTTYLPRTCRSKIPSSGRVTSTRWRPATRKLRRESKRCDAFAARPLRA